MIKNFTPSNTAVLAVMVIFAILICGYINMSHHAGMNMESGMNLASCSECVKAVFSSSASTSIAAFLSIVFIAFYAFTDGVRQNNTALLRRFFFKRITETLKPLYNKLILLFSDGIIHAKLYSFSNISQR